MTRLCAAVGAWLVPLILAGCQHIPREPLHLDEVRDALHERPLDIEPIRAYAEELHAPASGSVEPFSIEDGLSLAEAEAVGLWYNPRARRARLAVEHAQSAAEAAGRWPDPAVSIGRGEKETEGPEGLDRNWITSAGLSVTIPLSGRPAAERRLQEQVHQVALWAAEEAEWQALLAVREAWLTWSAAEARVTLLDGYLETLRPFHDVADALIDAGERPAASTRLLVVEYERNAAERIRLLAEAEAARLGVLEVLGLVPDTPVTLNSDLSAETYTPSLNEDGTITGDHPALARLRAAYEVAERQLRVELRKQYPDITFAPLYTDESDETSLVLGLSAPVPVWNANRAGIAEAAAARDHARLDVEEAYQHLLVALERDRTQYRGAREAWTTLTEDVAALLDAQLKQALALQKAGELDLALLYDVLRQSLDTRKQLLDTQVAFCIAAIRIHGATTTDLAENAATKEIQL